MIFFIPLWRSKKMFIFARQKVNLVKNHKKSIVFFLFTDIRICKNFLRLSFYVLFCTPYRKNRDYFNNN